MKIVHTADWHLGMISRRVERLEDQLARVREIAEICEREQAEILVCAGDVFDVRGIAQLSGIVYQLGHILKPSIDRGMWVLFCAGNHDSESVFPMLRASSEFISREQQRVIFAARPGLMPITTASGERIQVMFVPYPSRTAYAFAAKEYQSLEERRKWLGQAVAEKVDEMFREGGKQKVPVLVVGHLLMSGQTLPNGDELTEEQDIPVTVQLGGAAYAALGHIHRPGQVGLQHVRYSGSAERLDFGDFDQPKSVVLVQLEGPKVTGLREIPLKATELRFIEASDLTELERAGREVPAGAIVGLRLHLKAGDSRRLLEDRARELFPGRLSMPVEVHREGSELLPAATLQARDVGATARAYVAGKIAEGDPERTSLLALLDDLITSVEAEAE